MSQSLRDVLHDIVNELPLSSETQRERFHAAVDAATQEPDLSIHNVGPAVTVTPTGPTPDNPYPDAVQG